MRTCTVVQEKPNIVSRKAMPVVQRATFCTSYPCGQAATLKARKGCMAERRRNISNPSYKGLLISENKAIGIFTI